jgi:hypothetical protein
MAVFPVLLADKGYDSHAFRKACRRRRTEPIIPRRGGKDIKGLGRLRYVVEQAVGLLHQFRRLAIRWERRLDIRPVWHQFPLRFRAEGSDESRDELLRRRRVVHPYDSRRGRARTAKEGDRCRSAESGARSDAG